MAPLSPLDLVNGEILGSLPCHLLVLLRRSAGPRVHDPAVPPVLTLAPGDAEGVADRVGPNVPEDLGHDDRGDGHPDRGPGRLERGSLELPHVLFFQSAGRAQCAAPGHKSVVLVDEFVHDYLFPLSEDEV